MARPRRTNRVAEQRAVFVAYGAGAVAAFSPPAPTGQAYIDAALMAVSTWLVVYAAASTPWWVLAAGAGAAVAVALDPVVGGVAVAGLVAGLVVGVRRRNQPELRAVSAGLTCNALAWAELDGFFGLSAVIAITVGAALLLTGIRRRPRPIRRRVWAGLGAAGVVGVLGCAGLALGASAARSDVTQGRQFAEQAIAALNRGDFAVAADRFEQAAQALARADDELNGPWTQPAALVPVAAQHRRAVADLAGTGAIATAEAAAALREIDPATLRLTNGRFDLDAVAALDGPFSRIDRALGQVSTTLAAAGSPWLLPVVRDQLDSLGMKVAENAPRLDNALTAVRLAPGFMGVDGPRRYLVLFTTPAEARGLGGFPGNYAELTFDGGALNMSAFGRVSELEQIALENGTALQGPAPFVERYGEFVSSADGRLSNAGWRNLTMAPHFPWVAETAVASYRQATGVELDGVIVLDVYVVAQLLAYTGPIQLPDLGVELTSENAAQYLLVDQYQLAQDANAERVDALEDAAELTVNSLLASTLPEPTELARHLGPLAAGRRLLVWTDDEAEQGLLENVGLLGELPTLEGGDGWALVVNNAGGNKIDSFLERRATYQRTIDPATGEISGTLRIELTNRSPATGLPDYMIANAVGLPPGTSRLYLSVYTAVDVVGARLDGQPWALQTGAELGWRTARNFVNIAPGATITIELDLAGRVPRPERVVTWIQPLVRPFDIDPTATEIEG